MYILDTESLGLKMEKNMSEKELWNIMCLCNGDNAVDHDMRRNMSDFILCVLGELVPWISKAQRSITLLSSEAEWAELLWL